MANHYTILTDVGAALIANAYRLGTKLSVARLAVGDGNGKLPNPNSSDTRLINERYRAQINQAFIDDANDAWVVFEVVLPPDVGGWWIREVALFDADDNMIAIGNYPEQYKPLLSEGASTTQTVRVVIQVLTSSAITLKVDPSVVLATRKYVDDTLAAHEKSRNHPYATTTQQGMAELATGTEARARADKKVVLTPETGGQMLAEHEQAGQAHTAEQIALEKLLSVFGDAGTVQSVLARLGGASRKTVGENKGDVMPVGAFGWGIPAPDRPCHDVDATGNLGLYYARGDQPGTFKGTHPALNGYVLWVTRPDDYANQIAFVDGGVGMFLRSYVRGKGWTQWGEITHTANPGTIINAIRATLEEVREGKSGSKAVTPEGLAVVLGAAGKLPLASENDVKGLTDAALATPAALFYGLFAKGGSGRFVLPIRDGFGNRTENLVIMIGQRSVSYNGSIQYTGKITLPAAFTKSLDGVFVSGRDTTNNLYRVVANELGRLDSFEYNYRYFDGSAQNGGSGANGFSWVAIGRDYA